MAVGADDQGASDVSEPAPAAIHAQPPAELIAKSGLFHPTWYRQVYMPPDTALSEIEHYIRFGVRAGAPPSPFFDVDYYAGVFERIDFRKTNPIIHYLETPIEARANTHPLFDRDHYAGAGPRLPPE